MIQGVIFDMDGLMFDTERLWDTLWEPTCQALGIPMPEDTAGPFIFMAKMQVAMGPVMADASVGGIQIRGFFTILPICSILVPSP